MINGEGKLPPRIPLPMSSYTPRDLDPAKLRKMNHSEWLQEFSEKLALNTKVEMTAFRAGTITRLHWAAEYVRLLEDDVRRLEREQRSPAHGPGSMNSPVREGAQHAQPGEAKEKAP